MVCVCVYMCVCVCVYVCLSVFKVSTEGSVTLLHVTCQCLLDINHGMSSSISIMQSRDSGKTNKETDFTNLLFSRVIFLNRPQCLHFLRRNVLIISNGPSQDREAAVV